MKQLRKKKYGFSSMPEQTGLFLFGRYSFYAKSDGN